MNLNSRKPASEMSNQEIERELKDFEWEYIALADWARSDEQYNAGCVYLYERKQSLVLEKELRVQGQPANIVCTGQVAGATASPLSSTSEPSPVKAAGSEPAATCR